MATSAQEMLDQLRAERGQPSPAKAELLRLRAEQGQNIETSPIDLPSNRRLISPSEYEQPIELDVPAPGSELAAQGVDVTTGSPVGRFASGFAQNDAIQADYLKRQLSEHFGQPVEVRMGPEGIEYIHPETRRRTLVDEAGLSMSDVSDAVGPGITVTGAVGGTLAGSVVGAPNVGAGIGAALGEGIRRGIGNTMGVRDETLSQAMIGSGQAGLTEGAASKGSELAMRSVQGLRNFVRPQPFTAEGAERVLSAAEADQAIANEIGRRTGEPFQPFTGQLSNDPKLLGAQSSALNNPQSAVRLREQQLQNETTLEGFFNELNPISSEPNTVTGRAIQNEARNQIRPRMNAAREWVGEQIDELENLTAQIPIAENSTIVRNLARQAAESREIIKGAEDEAWEGVREVMGLNPDTALSNVKIPVSDDLTITLRRLQAESAAAIDPTISAGKSALVPKGLQGDQLDLNQLQVHLSSLRRRRRISGRAEVATDPQGRDIRRIESELVNQRNTYLRQDNPELLAQLEDAERLTAIRAEQFDRGLLNQLLRKENGEWQLRDADLIGSTIGSGDKEAMQHLVTVLSNHPAGMPTLQTSFLQFYRNSVIENGLPSAARHSNFVTRHGEALDTLFPGDDRIRQLGEFEAVVTRNVTRFDRFESVVDKSFRGRIQNVAPERIAEDLLKAKFTHKDVTRLMNLAEVAGVKQQYQAAITDQIQRRFFSQSKGLKSGAIDTFIGANRDKLTAALGENYVSDMRLLLSGLNQARKTAGGIGTTRNPTLAEAISEGMARVSIGRPLSPGGVAMTRILKFRERAAQRLMAEAIADPKALRAIVAQGGRDIRSQSVARILSIYGASSLAMDMGSETTATPIPVLSPQTDIPRSKNRNEVTAELLDGAVNAPDSRGRTQALGKMLLSDYAATRAGEGFTGDLKQRAVADVLLDLGGKREPAQSEQDDRQGYQYAVQSGYRGTMQDWINDRRQTGNRR